MQQHEYVRALRVFSRSGDLMQRAVRAYMPASAAREAMAQAMQHETWRAA